MRGDHNRRRKRFGFRCYLTHLASLYHAIRDWLFLVSLSKQQQHPHNSNTLSTTIIVSGERPIHTLNYLLFNVTKDDESQMSCEKWRSIVFIQFLIFITFDHMCPFEWTLLVNEIRTLWWKLDELDAILPEFRYLKWNVNVNGRIWLVEAKHLNFLRKKFQKSWNFSLLQRNFAFCYDKQFVRHLYQQRIVEKAKFTVFFLFPKFLCDAFSAFKIQYWTLFEVIWFDLCVWFISFGWQN